MGLGVLETRDPNVPGKSDQSAMTVITNQRVAGTTFVIDDLLQARGDSHLKRDGNIILVPQPSEDPNDPLNWSLKKRDFILFILGLNSIVASTLSPLLAPNTLTLVAYFDGKTFTDIALLTGWHLLGVGTGGIIFIPAARVFGKRHLYLLGSLVIIISSAVGGTATKDTYTRMIVARVFQGVGLAPFEALVNASVGDLYFVHQRGVRMAASNMAVFGGAFFTPILVGKITSTLGWWWSFWLIAIIMAAFFPLLFFFVPETAYRRPAHLNIDMHDLVDFQRQTHDQMSDSTGDPETSKIVPSSHGSGEAKVIPPKVSFARSLLPFNGRKTDENPLKLFLRPFPLFLHPAIFWGCLTQGALIGWTVMIGVVLGFILLTPPLFFDEVKTGYIYTGPFIGAVLGFILAGVISDRLTKWMIRKNNGVYEPEFRIVLVIPQMITGCVGLYGFGWAAANVNIGGWFMPAFFFALEVMGMIIGAVASSLYLVDAHREIAVEAFTCLMMFKNFFSFGLTWSAYDWLVEAGAWKIFVAMGTTQLIVCLLSVPMYVFGKKNRALMKKYDILAILHLW